ncbi:molybdate ABC transporter substrate-binding protein [Halomonas saccharevitans]|uniref:Molybdate transport system substrate-binding protein n=1 Tax=Halomonas saccharevitans TaxID=416872 RepID=A0A1I6XQP9_9GAMM|nr:molybdate ABC transporter substrate-binding protein [Halomonas saccharevitans]SFT40745.1 molybdate transport system substrate-binding protein [Halomonas saccharevitans]
MTAVLRLALAAWLLAIASPAIAGPATVAAASSLQFAFPELVERFRAQGGAPVRINYGASGNFRRQIAQGAPFELFLSADEQSVLALDEEGFTEDAGVVYAVGRLAWIQPPGRGALPSEEDALSAVEAAIATHRAGEGRPRLALANPEHAPYGIAARQTLQQAGLWEDSAPLRVMGENVSQAARFALADEARGGLVAYSLALAPTLAARAEVVLIPDDRHAPLRQRMALMPDAGASARALYAWLQGKEAREILARFGFQPPTLPQAPADAS